MKITQEEYETLQKLYAEQISRLKETIHFFPNSVADSDIFRPAQTVARERLHICHELSEDLQWAKTALLEGEDIT